MDMTAAERALDLAALPEADLVALARQGRREAFRVLIQRGNQRLFRIARSVMRDDAEAEDVLQEAYTRAFAAFEGFRGEAGVMTWLTRIVLNEAHGRLRRRRPTVDIDTLADTAEVIRFPGGPEPSDPERDAARAEARRLLERAVDALPEPFRVVFILREIEECSIEETAAALGIRPETVKTRLHRARRQLRDELDAALSSAVTGAFPFLGRRCERITERTLARLEALGLFKG
jgi:RNA polymerase sigma-70 factor (ECF subfamily)